MTKASLKTNGGQVLWYYRLRYIDNILWRQLVNNTAIEFRGIVYSQTRGQIEYTDLSLLFQLYAAIDITTQIDRVRGFTHNHYVDTQRAHSCLSYSPAPPPLYFTRPFGLVWRSEVHCSSNIQRKYFV